MSRCGDKILNIKVLKGSVTNENHLHVILSAIFCKIDQTNIDKGIVMLRK